MAGIIFHFEDNDADVFSGRETDLSAWNYACKIGDINSAIIVNKTEEPLSTFDFDMHIMVVEELPVLEDKIAVMVCPWNNVESESLWDFDHDVVWYMFGPAAGWNETPKGRRVHIPQNGRGAAHSIHVATTVMYHRFKTLWL